MTTEQIWQLAGYVQTIGAYSAKTAAPSRNDEKQTRPAENRAPAAILFDQGRHPSIPIRGPRREGSPPKAGFAEFLPLLLLTGCSGWQSALDVHGQSAISLKQLIMLIVAVCSVIWALVMVALIFALWRRRERDASPFRPDPARERRMTIAGRIGCRGFGRHHRRVHVREFHHHARAQRGAATTISS